MFLLTHQSSGTHKAQIRSSQSSKFAVIATASCTEGDEGAARAAIRKSFPPAAAATLREVRDAAEIQTLCGDFFKSAHRKQVFRVWTFNSNAR